MENVMMKARPQWLLWAGIASLVWNMFGVAAFIMQATMSPEALSSLPPEQQQLWRDMGALTWIAYALAVGAGTIGAIGLIMKRAWSVWAFVISLAAIIAQFSHPLGYALSADMMHLMIFPAFIFTIAIAQWLLSRNWQRKGWLN